MADDKQTDFVDGVTPVVAAWLDRMQEIQQALAWNFNLGISGTSVVLTAGSLEAVASIIIKGKMRYVTAPLSVNLASQAAGTYGIWANTTSDDSDPTFTLQYVAGTSAPVGITYTRKIATVYWSGSALQDLTLLSPYVKHSFMHRYNGPDALPAGSVGSEQLRTAAVTSGAIAPNTVQPVNLTDDLLLRPQLMWTANFPNGGYNVPTGNYTIPDVQALVNSIPLSGYRRQVQMGVSFDAMVTSGTLSSYSFTVLGDNGAGYSDNLLLGLTAGTGSGAFEGRSQWYTSYLTTKNGITSENLPMLGYLSANVTNSGGSAVVTIYQINVYLRYVRI